MRPSSFFWTTWIPSLPNKGSRNPAISVKWPTLIEKKRCKKVFPCWAASTSLFYFVCLFTNQQNFCRLFDKMVRIPVPVFFIYTFLISVEIPLVHAKYDQPVFRLPLFFIGTTIFHVEFPYDCPALQVFYIVCNCDIGNTVPLKLLQHSLASFCHSPLIPIYVL